MVTHTFVGRLGTLQSELVFGDFIYFGLVSSEALHSRNLIPPYKSWVLV